MLYFQNVQVYRCRWSDNSTLIIISSASAVLVAGSVISVLGGRIQLSPYITLPSKSAYTPTSNVTLSYPLPSSAVKPTVVVNTPSEIGTCAGLSIDMSYSSGSGGQPWKSITTFVYGSNASAAKDLNAFLASHQSDLVAGSVVVVPSAYTFPGFYSIVVSLCSYLPLATPDFPP